MAPREGGLPAPKGQTGVVELSRAALPTRWGDFMIVAFADAAGRRLDDVALVRGDLVADGVVPVRVHSECLTGDAFGSLRCDCGDQLHLAMQRLGNSDRGLLLYMRQEGRGIGIAAKVQAYALQDSGLDTVEANLHLGFDDDMRDYDVAAKILAILGPDSIQLMTNNPNKVKGLRDAGVTISERLPIRMIPNEHNRNYLKIKRVKSGHLL